MNWAQTFIDFFSFKDPNVRWVVLGVWILSATSGFVGVFAYLRKRSLVGDAVSHAILPGICIAFMLTRVKNPWILMTGAFVAGWLAILCIDWITQQTKIKTDAATALVLSVFYGVGILLLTTIQQSGSGAQSGLDHFLFGKAAALTFEDFIPLLVSGAVMLGIVLLFFNTFRLVCFDPAFAQVLGIPVVRIEQLISSLTVVAIAIGIQAVGVVLMVALLITPAASGRYWTYRLGTLLVIAAVFGSLAGIGGAFISYAMPKMPTGPWVVLMLSLIAVVSVFLGKERGILIRKLRQIQKK
ncbi:MAG TPA: hypothetical protein DCM08_11395 [Microscillaceae bacterium]|jgi:manganese/zinc/iron transport system permease protein|nr:hypothetical protein [Microscillaceae bacterium]